MEQESQSQVQSDSNTKIFNNIFLVSTDKGSGPGVSDAHKVHFGKVEPFVKF